MSDVEPYSISDIKAIIVDDQDPIRKAMKRILAKMGISTIIECFDGESALKELGRQPNIDLVLCDIYMKKVSGFDVLHHIRSKAIRADIPIIIVTGEASKDDIVKASDMGADDYIIKPFQAEAMTAKVHQVLTKFYSPDVLTQKLRNAESSMMAGKARKAVKLYQEVMDLDPSSIRARHGYGVALFKCQRVDRAIKTLRENIALSKTYYRNYAALADIYIYLKNYANAILLLSKELEYNPKQPSRQNLLARLLLRQNDTVGAIEHFRESLRENIKDEEALLGMGEAFAQSDDITKALYYFRRLRRYHPDNVESFGAIIKYCLAAGEDKKAELILREERKSHPERPEACIYLAKFYLARNRLQEASEVIDELVKNDQSNWQIHKVIAAIEIKKKNYPQAIVSLKESIKKKPEIESFVALAECYQRLNRFREGIASLHRALSKSPGNPKALFLLAQIQKRSKQIAKAFLLFRIAKKCGADPSRCDKGIQLCQKQILDRRSGGLGRLKNTG